MLVYIYTVEEKIYRIEYWAVDLAVLEYLAILQKMVYSFHIAEQ